MPVYSSKLPIGATVRRLRRSQGLTQQQLGELADTGVIFISQLERGKSTVRLDKLIAVLNVLGLELFIRRGKHRVAVDSNLLGDQ